QPKEQQGRKPKTLIIADWTASTWTAERIRSVNALLHQFLDEKFPVYAWSNDKLTALSLNGFDSLYLRNNMTPASYQDIVSFAASQHQWRKDTICVLDDYALERLIVPESTSKIRSIKTRDVLDSLHPSNDIESFILQAVPPIGEIYVDPEGNYLQTFIQNVAKKCSAITQKTSVMHIPYTAEEAESLEQELKSSADLLSLIDKPVYLGGGLNDVLLSTTEQSTFLIPLLPRIRKIEYSCSPLAQLDLNYGSLANLESLSITDLVEADGEQLNLFLRRLTKAPNLRKISLSGEFICSSPVKIESDSLKSFSFESLSFKYCRISPDDLFIILRQSSPIRQLNLVGVQFEGVTEMHWNDLVFEHLELLSLSSDATSPNAETIFIRILERSPNIKDLSLSGIILTSFLNGSDITFHQLECLSVTINQSPESIQQLSIIIEKAPHLRQLKLAFHEMPSDPQHMATLDLARIESLEVDAGWCDPMPIIPFLFKKCHHLRNISVISRRALEPFDVTSMITDLDAPHLRKLNLTGCGMTRTSLSNLMTKSLYLRSISPIYAILAKSRTLHPSEQAQQARLKTMLMEADDCSLHEPYLSDYKKALQSALRIPKGSEDRPDDSSTHRMYNPKRPFQFRGMNQTNNQTMIIDKLSQYMTLMRAHTSLIHRIQQGICNALAHLYLNEEPLAFARKVNMIREWDGHTSPHDQLRLIFEHIVTMIKCYQLSPSSRVLYYLGDSLDAFLNDLNEPCVLVNPWHAICIKPHDESSWWVYDPNYQNGAKKVPFNALKITIQQAIGSLVACKKHTSIQASIDNSGLFIQGGGLLALNDFHNLSMQLIPEGYTYTLEHLEGLLLYDMKGVPAWVIGIKNGKTAAYTGTLLQKFIQLQLKERAVERLKESIRGMSAFERYILMSDLLKNVGEHDNVGLTETIMRMGVQLVINSRLLIMDAGINNVYQTVDACLMTPLAQMLSYAQSVTPWREIVISPPLPHPQRNALTLRQNNAVYAESPEAYCLQTIRSSVLKKLIDLSSMEAIQAFSLLLLKTCLSTSRPVFYVDTADDLRCQSPYIKYQTNNVGILSAGPGGRLFDFIQSALSNPDSSPVLIVNYAHFKPSEMARFNALLDDARSADGISLPEKMQIIGLINTSDPNCYEGADFYSRMHQHERCPFDTKRLMSALKPLPFIAAHDDMPAHIIHLFHGADWRERLLGRWIIQG
ncbi:MAG TPA: hypothetical protein DDY37_00520, partial [Legionella sp.]|nr:hypothetical protein [Legionella sp.]